MEALDHADSLDTILAAPNPDWRDVEVRAAAVLAIAQRELRRDPDEVVRKSRGVDDPTGSPFSSD